MDFCIRVAFNFLLQQLIQDNMGCLNKDGDVKLH